MFVGTQVQEMSPEAWVRETLQVDFRLDAGSRLLLTGSKESFLVLSV